MTSGPSRRTVLTLAAAAGTTGLVAGCGGGGDASPASSDPTSAGSPAPGNSSGSGAGGEVLVPTADVPVGSGVILADAKVVVTQPTDGEFRAFSSTCTHQACQLSGFADDRITCMCHGSSFSITDGSPRGGPARSPLPEIGIAVEGESIIRS